MQLSDLHPSSLIQAIRLCLSSCVHCGTPTSNPLWLCEPCLKQVHPFFIATTILPEYSKILTTSLLSWENKNFHPLTSLIYSLKNPSHTEIWQAWAQQLAVKLVNSSQLLPPLHQTVLIPCPSRQNFRFDHAFALAFNLSKHLDISVSMALGERSQAPQKELRLLERKQIQMKLLDTDVLKFKYFVFVDDIISSGNTAMAAWKALGSPKKFYVWTLFHRPKLALKSEL